LLVRMLVRMPPAVLHVPNHVFLLLVRMCRC